MPLVNANCTNCGGVLQVDNEKEAWVCPYCKTPFIVEKAINNYNTTINNSYNIQNATFNAVEKDFKIQGGVLVKYVGEAQIVDIPSSVVEIGSGAFKDLAVVEINIPESVKVIGHNAFCSCKHLKKIVLPNGLEEIGGWAFDGCKSLTEITIPKNVKLKYDSRILNGCTGLKKIKILCEGVGDTKTVYANCLSSNPLSLDSIEIACNKAYGFNGWTIKGLGAKYCQACGTRLPLVFNKGTCSLCGLKHF